MRYANEKDVISLNWLPIIEQIDFEISKLAHKALNDKSWPTYLKLNRKNIVRDLRSNNSQIIEKSKDKLTFHYNAEKVFNELPLNIKEKDNFKLLSKSSKNFFKDKSLARIMHP